MAEVYFDGHEHEDVLGDRVTVLQEDALRLDVRFTRDPYRIERHGGWIDLQCAQDTLIMPQRAAVVPLGVNIRVPEGYETIIAPRSSTFLRHGILMANSIGIVEQGYCGNLDELGMVAFNPSDGPVAVERGLRICQFKVVRAMPDVFLNFVDDMGGVSRGGYGSTGT